MLPVSEQAPAFDLHVRHVAHRVRASLAETLSQLGIDPTKPQVMSRQLGLDKSLAWKTSRLVSDDDPFAAMPRLPGRSGQKILIKALEQAGATRDALKSVQDSMDEFERLVEIHAGDRETLEVMVANLSPQGASERDETSRKLAFQGNSAIFGVQARVQHTLHVVTPSATPDYVDIAVINGLVDLRRLRSDTPWAVAILRSYNDAGIEKEYGHVATLDGQTLPPNTLPLLKDFSSPHLPPLLTSRTTDGGVRFELPPGTVGNTGACTCVNGWISRAAGCIRRTPDDQFGEHGIHWNTPTEVAVFDLFVHRSLTFAHHPKAVVYSQLPGGPTYPRDGHERGMLPLSEPLIELGAPPELTAPELPKYRSLVETATRALGFPTTDFVGFRLRLRYPPIPTMTVFRYALPG
jgi:hypothetical protein